MSGHSRVVFVVAAIAVVGTLMMMRGDASATHYYTGFRWQPSTINWCFGTTMPSNWQNEYVAAVNEWNLPSRWFLAYAQTCSNAPMWLSRRSFSQYGDGNVPGKNYVFLDVTQTWVQSSFAYLNTDMAWSTNLPAGASMGSQDNPCNPSCDIRTIILHEIGHAVSFTHGGCNTSTMCVDFKVRRTLSSHDGSSMRTIYP